MRSREAVGPAMACLCELLSEICIVDIVACEWQLLLGGARVRAPSSQQTSRHRDSWRGRRGSIKPLVSGRTGWWKTEKGR
jgi:hypothetical protein